MTRHSDSQSHLSTRGAPFHVMLPLDGLSTARVVLESWITQHYTHRILNVLVIPLQVSNSSHCIVYNTQHYTHRILNVLVIPLQVSSSSHCIVYNTQHYTHRILNVLVIPLQFPTNLTALAASNPFRQRFSSRRSLCAYIAFSQVSERCLLVLSHKDG
jgi:hypothetical protein